MRLQLCDESYVGARRRGRALEVVDANLTWSLNSSAMSACSCKVRMRCCDSNHAQLGRMRRSDQQQTLARAHADNAERCNGASSKRTIGRIEYISPWDQAVIARKGAVHGVSRRVAGSAQQDRTPFRPRCARPKEAECGARKTWASETDG
jgi:hypothetical protein